MNILYFTKTTHILIAWAFNDLQTRFVIVVVFHTEQKDGFNKL